MGNRTGIHVLGFCYFLHDAATVLFTITVSYYYLFLGQLFKKRDIDDNSLEALRTSQLKSSILTAKGTYRISC